MKIAGGIRKAVEMTNCMARWGSIPFLVTPEGVPPVWIESHAQIASVSEAESLKFDLLIYSDPDVMPHVGRMTADSKLNYHLASYMLYRRDDTDLRLFYSAGDDVHHVANSEWTRGNIIGHSSIIVNEEVFGGAVNREQFSPRLEDRIFDCSYFGGRNHKGGMTILEATIGLRRLSLRDVNPPQDQLASWISKSRVFVSGAWHEGFNLVALEAMACGVPVVMTDDGGSRDYAQNEWNALVVPVNDAEAMRSAINRALTDQRLRLRLIENGLKTASRHDWATVSARLSDYIATIVS